MAAFALQNDSWAVFLLKGIDKKQDVMYSCHTINDMMYD